MINMVISIIVSLYSFHQANSEHLGAIQNKNVSSQHRSCAIIVQFLYIKTIVTRRWYKQSDGLTWSLCLLDDSSEPVVSQKTGNYNYAIILVLFVSHRILYSFLIFRVEKAHVGMYIRKSLTPNIQIYYIGWPSKENASNKHSLRLAHPPLTVCRMKYSLMKSAMNIYKHHTLHRPWPPLLFHYFLPTPIKEK